MLQYFCADESQSVSYKTAKVYLAAIRLLIIEHNMPDPTDDNLLHLVCMGIRRLQGDSEHIRLPITINIPAYNQGAAMLFYVHCPGGKNAMVCLHHSILWVFESW